MLRRLFGERSKPKFEPVSTVVRFAETERDDSWYVPKDGDESRFLAEDGSLALHLIPYRDGKGEARLRKA